MNSHDHYLERASALRFAGDAVIGGRRVAAERRFQSTNPANGAVLAEVARCGAAEVDRAVVSARSAFEDGRWRDLPPRERKARLLHLARRIEDDGEALALTETLDMGKPISDALQLDIPLTARCIAWYAEAIDKVYDEVAPTAENVVAIVRREPVGVVGAVVPWNFPLMLAAWKIAPALAAGNSVVLKPAEQSPLSAIRLGELALEAGIPDGVLNVVPGFGEEAGAALGRHPDVDAVGFTGSTAVGKLFLGYAAESNMKRVALECGGKNPHIVMPDCPDFDRAAKAAVDGIFFNQGEACTAGSRLIVHESIHADFVERMIAEADVYRPGDPLDPATRMGPLVDRAHCDRVMGYIEAAEREGAVIALGGRRVREESGGHFIEATILDRVSPDAAVAREEVFGPVLAVLPFRDAEEAIRIANRTIYGLAGAVWTSDVSTALTMVKAIRAGSVSVNAYNDGDITTPFGGYKQSGIGRDRSLHAFDKCTELKTIWIEL